VHVGPRATFDDAHRTVEAHVLGWPGPLAEGGAEYGWPLTLRLVSWLRGQARFGSVGELIEQMGRDCARAAEVLGRQAPEPARALQEAGA
jgi:riboflavin kinase/FMN adenylyltransferase